MSPEQPHRPPRLRPLAGSFMANVAAAEGTPESELLERLEAALAELPEAERAAAVVAIGMAEGPVGVAMELGLAPEDAEALTRNAVQLLRGALADLGPDIPEDHARLGPRRRRRDD